MNCTGARSLEEAKKAINQMLRKLKKLGVKVKKPRIEVQNIVATCELGKPIDLDRVLELEDTEYEPEQFPGLVYRTKKGVAFLVFAGGRMVCAGARTVKEAQEAIKQFIKKLKKIGAIK